MRIIQQIFLLLFMTALALPVYAIETGTVTGNNQVNFTPWRAPITPGRREADPHPDTSFPQTMSGTQADTQFGRNLPAGFSQAGLFDVTNTSGVGDFQYVINRMNSTPTATGRLSQLQTEINQNQSQAGYIFNNKFGISSMTDSSGNYLATGNFIQTRQDLVSGTVQTTTCVGTFTSDPVNGFTLTSGTAEGRGSGCTTK